MATNPSAAEHDVFGYRFRTGAGVDDERPELGRQTSRYL